MRAFPLLAVGGLACATAANAPDSLASGAAAASPSANNTALRSAVLARADGLTLTEADVDRYVQNHPKVARQLYDLRHSALDEITVDALVEAAARRAGRAPEEWVRAEVDRQVAIPSDPEVRAYFESRLVGENRNYRYEDIGPQIREHLLGQRRQEALATLLQRLKAEAHLVVLLPPPRVAVPQQGPARGPASAPVTIVEFSDYECPFCQRQEAALRQLLAAYPTQVRLVVRDYPLDMHPDARGAAHAAVCADRQGRFWELHDLMFGGRLAEALSAGARAEEIAPASATEASPDLSPAGLRKLARSAGLDLARFDTCIGSPEAEGQVVDSLKAGEQAGVDGTPALFLNGRPFSGAVSFAELKATVDEELGLLAKAAREPRRPGEPPATLPAN